MYPPNSCLALSARAVEYVDPPPHGAACWLWAATRKALGWDPGG